MNPNITMSVQSAQRSTAILTHFGLSIPTALDEALGVHEAVAIPTEPPSIEHVIAGVTRTDSLKAVGQWIDARRQHEARQRYAPEIQTATARRVIRAHQETAREILEAARPVFGDWADKFTQAIRRLPPLWRNAEAIVDQGGTSADGYLAARAAVVELDLLHDLRRATPGTRIDGNLAAGLEFCEAPHTLLAEAIGQARPTTPLGRWAEWLEVDRAVTLVWRNAAEHAQAIAACPVWELRAERTNAGGFVGLRETPRPANVGPPSRRPVPDFSRVGKVRG